MLPQALSIFPVGNASNTTLPIAPFSDATEQQLASFKATAWKVTTAALIPQVNEGGRRRKAAVTAPEDADDSQDKFSLIVHQLLKMLESTSAATVCGGARALRCIAEARAHAVHAAGDEYSEDARITDLLAVRFSSLGNVVLILSSHRATAPSSEHPSSKLALLFWNGVLTACH